MKEALRKIICLLGFHDYAYMGQVGYFDTWLPVERCFYCNHWRAAKHVRPQSIFAYKERELPDQ